MSRRLLSGPDWFERKYRRQGETKTDALTRLSAETGLQVKTLYRVLREQTVSTRTVQALRCVAGADRLDVSRVTLARGESSPGEAAADEKPTAEGAA